MGDVFILLTVRERKNWVQVCQFDEYARSVTAYTHCIVYIGHVKPLPQQQGMSKTPRGHHLLLQYKHHTCSETGRHKRHWWPQIWSDQSLGVLSGDLNKSLQLVLWIKHIYGCLPQCHRHKKAITDKAHHQVRLVWTPAEAFCREILWVHSTQLPRSDRKEEYKDGNRLDCEYPQTLLWSFRQIFVLWNLPNSDSKENHQTVARTETFPYCF